MCVPPCVSIEYRGVPFPWLHGMSVDNLKYWWSSPSAFFETGILFYAVYKRIAVL